MAQAAAVPEPARKRRRFKGGIIVCSTCLILLQGNPTGQDLDRICSIMAGGRQEYKLPRGTPPNHQTAQDVVSIDFAAS
jgi:hypothetical protein